MRQQRLFLEDDLRIPGKPAAGLIGRLIALVEGRDGNGIRAAENSGHGLGSRAQYVDVGIVDGFVPARCAGMDAGTGAVGGSAKTLDGLGPQYAEGAELGNLKKIARANCKGEADSGCRADRSSTSRDCISARKSTPAARVKPTSSTAVAPDSSNREPSIVKGMNAGRRGLDDLRGEVRICKRVQSCRYQRRVRALLQSPHQKANERLAGILEMHGNFLQVEPGAFPGPRHCGLQR